jgi:hypothetical protein
VCGTGGCAGADRTPPGPRAATLARWPRLVQGQGVVLRGGGTLTLAAVASTLCRNAHGGVSEAQRGAGLARALPPACACAPACCRHPTLCCVPTAAKLHSPGMPSIRGVARQESALCVAPARLGAVSAPSIRPGATKRRHGANIARRRGAGRACGAKQAGASDAGKREVAPRCPNWGMKPSRKPACLSAPIKEAAGRFGHARRHARPNKRWASSVSRQGHTT